MPLYSEEKVVLEKVWIQIPVESDSKTIPLNHETYLVQPRVAEYILLLEQTINGELPKLSNQTK